MSSDNKSTIPVVVRRDSANPDQPHVRRYSHNEDLEVFSMDHAPLEPPAVWRKKMVTWFSRWDADQDGALTRKDFEILAQRMEQECSNATMKSRLHYIFIYLWEHFVSAEETADTGVVTLDEWIDSHFRARLQWDKNPTVGASLIATFGLLFDAIDTAASGEVSLEEYRAFFSVMGLPRPLADDAFHRMDRNSDNRLSRDEFLDAVMAYYSELEPSEDELMHSLFLGPLVDTADVTSDLVMKLSYA